MLYPLSYGGPGRSNVTSRGVPPPAEPTAASLDRMEALGRVLVIDDSEVIRHLITINLELEGFEVVTAVDGQDALDKIHEVQPDVITIDVKMPRHGRAGHGGAAARRPAHGRAQDRDGHRVRAGGRPPPG